MARCLIILGLGSLLSLLLPSSPGMLPQSYGAESKPAAITPFPAEKSIDVDDVSHRESLLQTILSTRIESEREQIVSCGDWTEAAVMNTDGTLLLTGSNKGDGQSRLVDIAGCRTLGSIRFEGSVMDTAFHPKEPRLYAVDTSESIHAWDAKTFQKVATFNPLPNNKLIRLATHPEAEVFLAGTVTGRVFAWEDGADKPLREYHPKHQGEIRDIAFHPNGRLFATAGSDGDVRLWKCDASMPLRTIPYAGKKDLFAVRFSPDGTKLAVTSKWNDHFVRIYDVETGELVRTFGGYGKAIRSVGFSPDGRFLATGDVDYLVVVWDITTKKPLWSSNHNAGNHIYRVLFTPRQDRLIIISGFAPAAFKMPSSMLIIK